MRTTNLALAAFLAALAVSANAGTRMESGPSPFTYEALGATPSLTFGRKAAPAVAPQAVEAAKQAPAANATARPAARAAAATSGTFTYDSVGATPRVGAAKPAVTEVRQPTR